MGRSCRWRGRADRAALALMAEYRELAEYTGYLIRRAQRLHAALWLREVGSDFTSVQFGC